MFDQRREINVIPRFVLALAARHQDQTRQDARHLHDGVKQFATLFGARAHQEVVALVQELRKRMAGIDRQRRQHREDFLPEIAASPGGAFRVELRDVVDADAVLRQERARVHRARARIASRPVRARCVGWR